MIRSTPDREAAARLLLRQSQEQGRLDLWLRDQTRQLAPLERRRVHALVYGVTRNRTLLGLHLAPFLRRPMRRQTEELQVVLLLGAYELLYQDSVPDRAAVHEAVQLARSLGQNKATGFVNAVLRKVARAERPPRLPDRVDQPLDWAEQVASHPRWLVDEMAAVAPEEVADWAEAHNREPPLTIRLRDPGDDAIVGALGGTRSELVPGAVTLGERPKGPVEELPGFAEGRWWVQDLGAQAVVAMLAVQPGQQVLDACAAPGGKTLAAALHAGPDGRVVAVDRSAGRLGLLRAATRRIGLTGVEILQRDLLAAAWDGGHFDAVLLDAPCTGLGVVRRHPEIRWNRLPSDLGLQAARQRSLLLRLAEAVAPGGTLVYSVCTFSRAETTGVLDDFLSRREDFAEEAPPAGALDAALLDGSRLRTRPHLHDADAFFAVRLVRERGT